MCTHSSAVKPRSSRSHTEVHTYIIMYVCIDDLILTLYIRSWCYATPTCVGCHAHLCWMPLLVANTVSFWPSGCRHSSEVRYSCPAHPHPPQRRILPLLPTPHPLSPQRRLLKPYQCGMKALVLPPPPMKGFTPCECSDTRHHMQRA